MRVAANIEDVFSVHLLLINDWHEEVHRHEEQGPAETRRGNADDRERMFIELNGPADHVAIILKPAVPKCIAEHEIRCTVGTMLVGAAEEAPQIRVKL